MATNIDPDEIVKQVTDRISESYTEVNREHISSLAREELEKISSSRVTDYFAVLTERAVRSRLKA
ncbi:three-helix bundle dimerization domain-containing protein [Microbacterium sp. ZW T5_45]|uniref:three-helix bundle dimerization domain-containing protein n=1 Tax=Microbacterium sp. ZW T5_45 TaxID=3378080 RepID=UPI003852DEF3